MVRLTRRLSDEFETVRAFLSGHPHIHLVAVAGQPADRYTVEYKLRGLAPAIDGRTGPEERNSHLVLFFLFPGFPLQSPSCRFLTPIFHPAVKGDINNLADVWDPKWELTDLILYVGRAIVFQEVGPKPVLNQEAAAWMVNNAHLLPLDQANLRRPVDLSLPHGPDVDPHAPNLAPAAGHYGAVSPGMAAVLNDVHYPAPIWREDSDEILGLASDYAASAFPGGSAAPGREAFGPEGHHAAQAGPQAGHQVQRQGFALVGAHARLTEVSSGICHVLPEGELTIGRGPHNQIVISDSSVSRIHCRLQYSQSGYNLVDLSSTNGTFVNESPVSVATMHPGDKLRLGGALMIFEQD